MRRTKPSRAIAAIAAVVGLSVATLAGGAWALTEQALSETEVEALQFYHDPTLLSEGTVPWQTLADIEVTVSAPAPFQTTMTRDFGQSIRSLDGTTVKLQGFIFPLQGGESHEYFLLSAYPPGCPFCLPGGPTNLVEIKSAEPVDYTQKAVLIEGRFEILKDDPTGLYYRLSDARQVVN